jgi:Signal transduction histidine kinase
MFLPHSQSKKPCTNKFNDKTKYGSVSVQDFAIEISNQNIQMLTKRFYRIDTSRPRDTGHTALGLSMVNIFLNRHNAQLNIQSEVNKGSSFSITFEKYKSS